MYGIVINGIPMIRLGDFTFMTLTDYIMSNGVKSVIEKVAV